MQELKIVRGKIQSHYMLVKTDEDLGWNRAIDLCTNIINAHIKHMTDGWIPVEERMPEEGKEVLVTTDQGDVTFGYFCDGEAYTDLEPDYPIAWRPVPEAYRPERSEK